jgi:hypothetical protein
VRDVGAHLAFAHARVREVVWPAVRTGLRYNAMIEYAAPRSPLTPEQIVATLRSFVGSRRRAPFVTELEPLLDVLVHVQDICLLLGIDHAMPVDAAVAAADRAYGDGPVVQAPMRSHLTTLTGRRPSSARTTTARPEPAQQGPRALPTD